MFTLIAFALLCAATRAILPDEKPYYDIEKAEVYFKEYIIKFKKSYETQAEYSRRFEIFISNLIKINQFNEEQEHATSDVNFLTDMSEDERKSILGYRPSGLPRKPFPVEMPAGDDYPENVDWRSNNSVSPVKNQGKCASSHAFSLTAVVESQYAIVHKKMLDLSEQQILDCDSGDMGCDGGDLYVAAKYLILHGQMLESDNPYKGSNGICKYNASKLAVQFQEGDIFGFASENLMANNLAIYGPISAGIHMSEQLLTYKNGVMTPTDCKDKEINFIVTIVGYGIMDGIPYWLIKNSLGTDWGDEGYFRLRRGLKLCSINAEVAFAFVL